MWFSYLFGQNINLILPKEILSLPGRVTVFRCAQCRLDTALALALGHIVGEEVIEKETEFTLRAAAF